MRTSPSMKYYKKEESWIEAPLEHLQRDFPSFYEVFVLEDIRESEKTLTWKRRHRKNMKTMREAYEKRRKELREKNTSLIEEGDV